MQRAFPLLVGAILLMGLLWPCAAQASPVYNPANGHWYWAVRVGSDFLDWPTARAAAEESSYAGYRGHLAVITSDDEQQFIATHLPVQNSLFWWMGTYQDKTAPDYHEPDAGWRWVTGEPWGAYTHWSSGRP